MFAYSAACLTSSLICHISPKQPPSVWGVWIFYLCCSFLEQSCRLPGRMWLCFLLSLCLSRYVLLLLELKRRTVCLLTTRSCKVSHVLDCKLSNTLSLSCVAVQFSFSTSMFCIYRSSSWIQNLATQSHFDWLQQTFAMYMCHYRGNPGSNSSRWCNTEM